MTSTFTKSANNRLTNKDNYYKGIELSIILKNKPGSFNSIYSMLQEIKDINVDDIKALVLLSEGNFGILRIVVDTEEKAEIISNALLNRHFIVSYTVVLKLYDWSSYERIKQISECFRPIYDRDDPKIVLYKGINIEYIYTSSNNLLVMKVADPQGAIIKLKKDFKELFPDVPVEESKRGE